MGMLTLNRKSNTVISVKLTKGNYQWCYYIHGSGWVSLGIEIHLDYAGPFQGKMFLVILDSYTWNGLTYMLQVQLPQLSPLTNFRIHSQSLSYLKWLFLIMGLFQQPGVPNLCEQNGIQHVRTAAYHPSSNGLTEHYVQIINDDLKKITASSLELWLARLLLRYTVTPQSMTEVSPVELMFGRKLRTILNLLQSDLGNRVRQPQAKQKQE